MHSTNQGGKWVSQYRDDKIMSFLILNAGRRYVQGPTALQYVISRKPKTNMPFLLALNKVQNDAPARIPTRKAG